MSYNEYINEYKSAQKKDCKYRLFAFDGINHRVEDLISYRLNVIKLVDAVTEDIFRLEKERNIQILDRDEPTILIKKQEEVRSEYKKAKSAGIITRVEIFNPIFSLGDMIIFSVYNHSIEEKEFFDIFDKNLNNLNLHYKFYRGSCLYETNHYHEGETKLYKGYAFDFVIDNAKIKYKKQQSKNSSKIEKEMV